MVTKNGSSKVSSLVGVGVQIKCSQSLVSGRKYYVIAKYVCLRAYSVQLLSTHTQKKKRKKKMSPNDEPVTLLFNVDICTYIFDFFLSLPLHIYTSICGVCTSMEKKKNVVSYPSRALNIWGRIFASQYLHTYRVGITTSRNYFLALAFKITH